MLIDFTEPFTVPIPSLLWLLASSFKTVTNHVSLRCLHMSFSDSMSFEITTAQCQVDEGRHFRVFSTKESVELTDHWDP